MITVIGASGQVGSKVADELIESGHRVRVLGRSTQTLSRFAGSDADIEVGDLADTEWLTDCLRGSDAVFAMVPSNPFTPNFTEEQDRYGESICTALQLGAVPTVVALSSLGADRADAPGVIGGLHRQELRLSSLSARLTLLRPVSFFENLVAAVDQIVESGAHVDSVQADLPIPMIATVDVAHAAVPALADDAWNGHVVRNLLGHRDISYVEATSILGRCLGVDDARYTQVPFESMNEVLVAVGFSADYARQYVDMTRAFNSGELTDPTPRTAENTTTTSFDEFASSLHLSTGRAS